ncbi:acetamidase/formamidase family protein [Sediminivirga luteola]|uniref:acetamidase/formamidase family protein n=1 Tax=Sediminivirga luteola TaxID=1774748 RepID=UPI001F563A6B|nr:acetamidase/formamidase family protein [Sediminivirga luteola]MCI2266865.1 acetamidase/formamidase family protein [Sediminivirga luteola]
MTVDHLLGKELGKGAFRADEEPVLRIAPGTGERIGFQTSDAWYAQLHELQALDRVTEQVNPVTGPVYVEGAEPGDTLAVTVHDIVLGEHGWSVYLPAVGALQRRMGGEPMTRRVPLEDGFAQLTETVSVPVAPMIGCIGTAPAEGSASTVMPSYAGGGNMDLTDCAPGTTVHLPVEVDGALLSLGDIHAVMARGESSFVAIEAAGTAVVTIDLLKARPLRAPRLETSGEWLFVGLGDPVQESIARGYEDMFDFLVKDHGWSPADAYVVMSAAAHSELGGPTGSEQPDPLHPMRPVGAVTVHRLPKSVLA